MDWVDDFTTPVSDPPAVDAIIVDGAAVVIQEQPEHSVTMKTVFLPYIDRQSQLHDAHRIDLVGVIYAFLTVLCHQQGRVGEREYIGGCSSQSTGRSLSLLTNLRYTCLSSQRMK